MNKILVITTKGCEACDIAIQNIKQAVYQSSKDIYVESRDWHDLHRNFIVAHKVKDYPTILYMIDSNVVNKVCGTYPIAVYLRWIDIYF